MTDTRHALVIGKFHPPHAGHELLFRTAAAAARRVSILVFAHPSEAITLDARMAWIRSMIADLPNVSVAGGIDAHPIDYEDPAVWDLHEGEFRALLATITDEAVTAVFASEDYGVELARRFDATAVVMDRDRMLAPISATMVRRDPVEHWEQLPASARAGLAVRVVVVGAESTGTTTVSRRLTDALRARGGSHGLTRWVPEFGRAFTVTKMAEAIARAALDSSPRPGADDLAWPTEEFAHIAATQNRIEDDAAALGGPVLVCDTDAFATGVWHERYVGSRSPTLERLARHHPLYLVTDHEEVPFEQDGLRDGEHLRAWMTGCFVERLTETGRAFVMLRGSLDERTTAALNAVDERLSRGWRFEVTDGDR